MQTDFAAQRYAQSLSRDMGRTVASDDIKGRLAKETNMDRRNWLLAVLQFLK